MMRFFEIILKIRNVSFSVEFNEKEMQNAHLVSCRVSPTCSALFCHWKKTQKGN